LNPGHPLRVRNVEPSELDALARLWFDAWQDAHAAISPPALTRVRTLPSFRDRLEHLLADIRAIGPSGAPLGFAIVQGDELYQLYVAAAARGTGVAAALTDDAEARIAATGVETAWLACAIGNERAARFYEKRGWSRVGTMTSQLDTLEGVFPLDVWRYEKPVLGSRGQ
jgi:ribosomal protein S18 acetylase RimI-like enzyme